MAAFPISDPEPAQKRDDSAPENRGIRMFGIADNGLQWSQAFLPPKSPLHSGFCLANLRQFSDQFDDSSIMLPAARVFSMARFPWISMVGSMHSTTDIDIAAIGEALAPNLPTSECLSTEHAESYFCEVVGQLLFKPDIINDNFKSWAEQHFSANPITNKIDFNTDQAVEILLAATKYYEQQTSGSASYLLVHMFLFVLKRGNPAPRVESEVTKGLSNECSLTITLSNDLIRKLYVVFGSHFTSKLAKSVFQRWANFLPSSALRLQLIVQQASWEGLTCLRTIDQALTKYRDFPWLKIAQLDPYKEEFNSYTVAKGIVKDDEYYGFNPRLGDVVSLKYKNLATVCMMILVEVEGDVKLKSHGAFCKKVPYEQQIKQVITKFANQQTR